MALLLEKPSDFSDEVLLSYWKVCDTNINWYEEKFIINIAGFIDESSRRAGKTPVKIISYSYPGTFPPSEDPFPFSVDDNVVAKTYEILKLKPEWSEAQDV
jgi:hypothetical protein